MSLLSTDLRTFGNFILHPSKFTNDFLIFCSKLYRMSASSLLTKLLSVRTRDTLSLVWNGMVSILQNDNTDPYHIDSALRILGNISSLLLSKPAVQSEVERIWMSYLLPKATVSAHSVVRARAQDFFGKFSGIVFLNNNDQLEQATVNSILKAVFEESDLFVKYEAILSLSLWLKREDCTIAKEMAAPYLGQLLNTIFAFLDHSMQNEEIVSSLDTIIDVFGEMIAPYALEIVRRFISIYNSLLNSTEDDENAVLTAVSAIRSINTLLYSVSDVKELWPELENLTQSIIQTGLSAQGMEVLEDVLDMITSFTYYPAEISPLVWSYLPMIGSVFHDFAGDALEEMLPAIDNYISKGSEVFVNGSNGAYLHVVLSITSAVLTDPNRSYEIKPACAILASIFIHCHEFENVKSQFPVILKLVAERFMAIKDDLKCGLSTKLSLLKVVSLFSYVNPALFIETLEGFGAGSIQLVNEWINLSTEMKAFNQKVFILGVSSLLRLRCVSPSPDKFLPSLLNQLVNVLTCLRKEAELGVHQDNAVFSEKYGQYDDEGFLDVPEEEDFIEEGDGQLPADAAFLQDMIANSGGYASDLSYLIRGDDDDDDGEGTQDSPIDRVDPFDYFRMCASEVHKADSRLFSSLVGTLSPEQQALFHQHLG